MHFAATLLTYVTVLDYIYDKKGLDRQCKSRFVYNNADVN